MTTNIDRWSLTYADQNHVASYGYFPTEEEAQDYAMQECIKKKSLLKLTNFFITRIKEQEEKDNTPKLQDKLTRYNVFMFDGNREDTFSSKQIGENCKSIEEANKTIINYIRNKAPHSKISDYMISEVQKDTTIM